MKNYFLLAFIFIAFSTHSISQRITELNLYSQVEYFFEDYTDLIIINDVFDNEGRTNVPIVHIMIEEVDWFVLSLAVFEGELLCAGSAEKEYINPNVFINNYASNSGDWFYDVDENGGLTFISIFSSITYNRPNKLSKEVNARFETLIIELSSYEELENTYDPYQDYNEDTYSVESIERCAEAIEREIYTLPYETKSMIQPYEYCKCLNEMIIDNPDLIYGVVNPTSPEGKFMMEACFDSYCPKCVENGLDFEYVFRTLDSDDIKDGAKKGFVRGCVDEMADDILFQDIGYAELEDFCECAYNEILEKGEGVSLDDFFDPNSTISVETAANCYSLLGGFEDISYWNDKNGLSGCYNKQSIPIIEMNGGFHVKVKIGDETKYLLIDSGAHEILINEFWAESLLESEAFVSKYPIGYEPFILADGSEVSVKKYQVKSMQVGDCTYRNFTLGVVPEGGMLFGMGFLGLFDSWKIDGKNKILILD